MAGHNGRDDGVVQGRIFFITGHDSPNLLLGEVTAGGIELIQDVFLKTAGCIELGDVFCYAVGQSVSDRLVLVVVPVQKLSGFQIVERLQLQLQIASAMKRSGFGQNFIPHKANERPAQDEEQIPCFPIRVNGFLQHGLNIGALLREIGVFVNEENDAFIPSLLPNKIEQLFEGLKADISRQLRSKRKER